MYAHKEYLRNFAIEECGLINFGRDVNKAYKKLRFHTNFHSEHKWLFINVSNEIFRCLR